VYAASQEMTPDVTGHAEGDRYSAATDNRTWVRLRTRMFT
jgi:hypothetical protein